MRNHLDAGGDPLDRREPMTAELLARIRAWMFEEALPFWAETGLDRAHGGCVESLAPDGGGPSGVGFKRARVLCRQTYVFAHAAVLGWGGARAACDHLYGALRDQWWRGRDEGWPRRLTAKGDVLDPTPDLYEYAFALFALGWRYKAFGDADALALAHQTLDLVERRFRHPRGAGFHHVLPPDGQRQQNPHMHLLEAALVLAEASGEPRFLALADELVGLFRTHMVRMPGGVLVECFNEDWRPRAGERGGLVEPGHQFEWAWILAQHQRLARADNAALVRALVGWAERHGVDPTSQATCNAVRDDGAPLDRGSRAWPNTERIKGWIGLYEVAGDDPSAAVAGSARLLLDRYLAPAPHGCWIDSFDERGESAQGVIPASTLYHLFLAFAETLRIVPALAASPAAKVAS